MHVEIAGGHGHRNQPDAHGMRVKPVRYSLCFLGTELKIVAHLCFIWGSAIGGWIVIEKEPLRS